MPEFTAQIMHLGQLFAHPFLIEAPAYQRAYAWASREAGQLLEDLLSAAEEGRAEYFLGTMLFIDRERAPVRRLVWGRGGPIRTLDVVDGFQRLTTLTILLCVLRDLGIGSDGAPSRRLAAAIRTDSGPGARARLTLGIPDEQFFAANVRASGASRRDPDGEEQTSSEKRLLEVRDHMRTTLADLDVEQRRRLLDFVLDWCCVVLVATTGIDRAHRMFTVLNATGKPLARNDVLKAALLGGVPRAAAPRVRALWMEAETRLGDRFESLFSHLHAMHGRPGGRVISGVLEMAEAAGGAQPFIERSLQPAALAFERVLSARHEGSPHSATINTFLGYLGWHTFSDWIPPAMLFWLERGDDTAELAWFLGALDRLAFAMRILGIGGAKRARRFGALVTAIRARRDLRGGDSPLALSRQEQRTIQHNLQDLHARNTPAAKHLLLRLCDAMAGEPQSRSLPADMTVEHVLPRKLAVQSPWRICFPTPEDRERCTESLGNLVLVTKAQNDKAGNLDFARKHEIYFAGGVPAPAINADLRDSSEWLPAHVKAREARLLRQIEQMWSFAMAGVPDRFVDPAAALARAAPQPALSSVA